MGILVSFLYLLLYIAVILLIAYAIKWGITDFMNWPIDANVMKFGQIVVFLICLIAAAIWLSGVVNGVPAAPWFR